MRPTSRLSAATLAALFLAFAPAAFAAPATDDIAAAAASAATGSPFSAALYVNGRAISNYMIEQRAKFLSAIEGPGDHSAEAAKGLVDDALRLSEAAKYGLKPNDADVKAGMEEFAARAQMTADQFSAALQKGGVDPQTFRDFVAAGIVWRQVVQGLIAPTVHVTEEDVKEAHALSLAHGTPRLLLSELILPDTPEYAAQSVPLIEQLSQTLHGDAAFEAAAKQYSASDTAPKGGRLDWIAANQLPNPVVQAVTGLAPGEVSRPVLLQGAIGIFEMRGIADAALPPAAQVQVDYAEYLLPGLGAQAAGEAATVRARARTCNDLYGIAKGQPPAVLSRQTVAQPQLPTEVAYELAKLDPGEASTNITRGGNTVFLMLCARTVTETPPQPEEDQANALFGARVNALADQKLDELRAAAIIRRP